MGLLMPAPEFCVRCSAENAHAGSRSSSVKLEVQMASHEPAADRLVEAARNAPDGLVDRLLESDDFRESLLGKAIRDLQQASVPSQEAGDEVLPINPVTHDPAW
ncbi:hypothetical protein [Streptomyces sp. NPDC004266]|uniref:hypothetical protein n=1 Tax=Streptomyces sp. NPDC004266 TaxID=3364693 RepID=UPI0036BF377D